MGKAGHGAVVDIWNDNMDMYLTPGDCADFVKYSLDGMVFVYNHPDTLVGIHVTTRTYRPVFIYLNSVY